MATCYRKIIPVTKLLQPPKLRHVLRVSKTFRPLARIFPNLKAVRKLYEPAKILLESIQGQATSASYFY